MQNKNKLFSNWLIIAGLVLILFPFASFSQVNVVHLSDSKAAWNKDGIIYSLPRTVINVSLVVNKIQKTKGPYTEFAEKYLGLSPVIESNSIEYDIKEIILSTTSEPDPEQFYFVEPGGKNSRKSKSIEMYLSEAGFLLDATDVSKSKKPHIEGSKNQQEQENSFADIVNPSMSERTDTIIRRVSVDTISVEQKVFRKIISEKNDDQKARDIADIIIELDEARLDLLSGEQEVGYGSNLEYMCKQLETMKAEYLALFKGIKSVTTTTYNYNFIPKPGETLQESILCRFSKLKSTSEVSSSVGEPVTIVVESLGSTKAIAGFINSKISEDKYPHGFSYRIPDYAKISIKVAGQPRLEAVFAVNQLGVISMIPSGDFSSLRLHQATGGLKRVILE